MKSPQLLWVMGGLGAALLLMALMAVLVSALSPLTVASVGGEPVSTDVVTIVGDGTTSDPLAVKDDSIGIEQLDITGADCPDDHHVIANSPGFRCNPAVTEVTWLSVVSNTGTNLAAQSAPRVLALSAGTVALVIPTTSNTGAMTLSVDALGSKDLKAADGTALSSGDLASGTLYLLTYTGTEWRKVGG